MTGSLLWWAAVDLVLLLAVLALVLVGLAVRRRVLQREGGFDLCLRLRPGRWGGGWVFGIGRYDGDRIAWFRTFGVGLRPRRWLVRRDLVVVGRRTPEGDDEWHVPAGHVVLACQQGERPLDLSMEEPVLTGFLAWLESAPPGQHVVA